MLLCLRLVHLAAAIAERPRDAKSVEIYRHLRCESGNVSEAMRNFDHSTNRKWCKDYRTTPVPMTLNDVQGQLQW